MSKDRWLELYSTDFRKSFAGYSSIESPTESALLELEEFIQGYLQANVFRWDRQGWKERISEAKSLLKTFKRSEYRELQSYLDSEDCCYQNLSAEVIENTLSVKSPSKKILATSLMEVLKKYDWDGDYYPDSVMGEGHISCLGYEYDFQFFLENKFGFFYRLEPSHEKGYPVKFSLTYESLMGLGSGDWDLVSKDSLDADMDIFEQSLSRLLWLVSSSLKAGNV